MSRSMYDFSLNSKADQNIICVKLITLVTSHFLGVGEAFIFVRPSVTLTTYE